MLILPVNAFTRIACKGFHFLPVLLSLSLRLSASVKKCLPLVVGSHSNFLLSQLDGGQPRRAPPQERQHTLLNFQLSHTLTSTSREEAFILVKSVGPEPHGDPKKQAVFHPRQLRLWRTTSVGAVFGDKYSQAL